MNTDVFGYEEETLSKRVQADAYHPPGLRGIPVVFPVVLLLFAGLAATGGLTEKDVAKSRFALQFAAAFGSFGLMLAWMCWQAVSINKRRLGATEPAMKDYPWDRTKSEVKGSGRFGTSLMWALVISVFLLIFNVELFKSGVRSFSTLTIAQVVVGLFDLLVVSMWFQAGYHWLQARKFGVTRVEFDRFPFSTSELVRLRWIVPRNIASVKSASFKLRCIHEFMEYGTDNKGDRTASIVNEQLWAGSWCLKQPSRWTEGEAIELEWQLPERAQPTGINSVPIIYWRLDISVGLPGTDFFASYLIPVYA